MKQFVHSSFTIILLLVTCMLLSCRTTKEITSASGKSETVVTSTDRLCSSLIADSLGQTLTLSVDSMFIVLTEQGIAMIPEGIALPTLVSESTSSRDADRKGAASLDDMYLHGYKPPATKGPIITDEQLQRFRTLRAAIKMYGLHVDAGTNKKSNVQTLTKDSVAKSTHSSNVKASEMRKSAPSNAPKYVFYILILALLLYGAYRLSKYLKR